MKSIKTLCAILFTSLLVFSAACGNNDSSSSNGADNDTDKADTTKNADSDSDKDQQEDQKGALMDWELDMIGKIHTTEEPFKGLASLANGEDVDQDAVKDLVAQTSDATNNLEKDIESIEVPSELDEDIQEKLKSAASDLAASYRARADAAKDLKGVSSAKKYASKVEDMNKAGDDKFDSFNKKVNNAESQLGIEGETDLAKEKE